MQKWVHDGIEKSLSQIATEQGIRLGTLWYRIREMGMTIEAALDYHKPNRAGGRRAGSPYDTDYGENWRSDTQEFSGALSAYGRRVFRRLNDES